MLLILYNSFAGERVQVMLASSGERLRSSLPRFFYCKPLPKPGKQEVTFEALSYRVFSSASLFLAV